MVNGREIDGISFLPELLGKKQNDHSYLYWEFHERGGAQAILMEPWKAVRLNVGEDPRAPLELYNLDEDPMEETNVAASHPELVKTLGEAMERAREPSEIFNFGRSGD